MPTAGISRFASGLGFAKLSNLVRPEGKTYPKWVAFGELDQLAEPVAMLIDLRRTETSGEHHHHGLAVRLREQVAEGIPLEAVAESLLAPYEDGDYSVTVVMEDTQADRAACPGRSVGPTAERLCRRGPRRAGPTL